MPTASAIPPSVMTLRSWRSTLIVATSIPLSILTSVIVLKVLNQSLSVMTLSDWFRTLSTMTEVRIDSGIDVATIKVLRQDLNVMTLGGMALAVGILVDDATVEIENNH